jgi:uncharacterized protein YcfL
LYSIDWGYDEPRCIEIEEEIRFAGNRSEFFEYITKEIDRLTRRIDKVGVRQLRSVKRLSILLRKISAGVDKPLHDQALMVLHRLSTIEGIISSNLLSKDRLRFYQNVVLQEVVQTIGELNQRRSEPLLRKLIETQEVTRGLRMVCVKALGLLGHDPTLFDFFADNLPYPKNISRSEWSDYRPENWRLIMYLAIGKAASTKASPPPIPASSFVQIKKTLSSQLKAERSNNWQVFRNLFWGIGEIFDHRGVDKTAYVPSAKEQQTFIEAIEDAALRQSQNARNELKSTHELVIRQIRGEALDDQQQKYRDYLLSLADIED